MSNAKINNLKTPIVIIGLGKSGQSAHRLLEMQGYTAQELFLFDEKLPAQINEWKQLQAMQIGTLVVSPGVPLQSEHLLRLKNLGWNITSEITLATQFITSEKIIGITGSVGKSTVTSLLGAALTTDDPNGFVGGNLGIPFCEYAISLLNGKPKAKWIALELSSYQLENCVGLSLDHSAITYLSVNHLERYTSVDEYYMTKCHIGDLTQGTCVLNRSSEDILTYQSKINCKTILTNTQTFENKSILKKIHLLGQHNKDNFCISYTLAKLMSLSEKAITAMTEFKGLAHRIEFVGNYKNIIFINDSKATAMDSVLVAVHAAKENLKGAGKLHLFIGGKDKNLPWHELANLNHDADIRIHYFGACGELARTKMQNNVSPYYKTLNEALDKVFPQLVAYDVALLSPGGTSLDEFKNFEDRGNFFKNKVIEFTKKS
ncbi:MAG: UDP-N-acetylmuramoyl-L-alanine--D-glutamate ligase [Pseudobdellovibrio sp.]